MADTGLRAAREQRGWTQAELAERLGVSQAYVSMVEQGRRRLGAARARRVFKELSLPPTVLPVESKLRVLPEQQLERALVGLGYPGFAHLRQRSGEEAVLNPAQLLFLALGQHHLDTRLAEALPWVILRFPDLDWEWLVAGAKAADLQNRLGFLVATARETAEKSGCHDLAARLQAPLATLERSRLAREDTLAREDLLPSQRRWLQEHRPPAARHWNLLTDMVPEHLAHAL